MSTDRARLEYCAEALFHHRFAKRKGGWELFVINHPDIAQVYRDNAQVFLDALDRLDNPASIQFQPNGAGNVSSGVSQSA